MEAEAAYLKVLAEPTRLRLAVLLAAEGETCVCQLAQALAAPEYRISRHLGIMRASGLVEAKRDGTWMHYRLAAPQSRMAACLLDCFRDCLADHPTGRRDCERLRKVVLPEDGATCRPGDTGASACKPKVLFLCTGNSCRSQMAEGWARVLLADVIEPYSAGTETHGLNANAVEAMAEAGVDISRHRSKLVDELSDVSFDLVVTVCGHAREICPVFPGKTEVIHAGFDDPPKLAAEAPSEEEAFDCYRRVRDDIRRFIQRLPEDVLGGASPPP